MHSIKEHIKRAIILAYPVVIGQLGFILMAVVDSLMVGRLGAAPLAAASLANSLVLLIYIIGIGVSFAVSPLVAIAHGAGKNEECGTLFRQSLIVNMLLSIVLLAVILIAISMIGFLNQPDDVVELAPSYAALIAISIVPMSIFQTFKQYIEGLAVMKPSMIVVLLANIVNAFFNWVLIFGNLGFPALGLDGAGYATIFSRLFMAGSIMFFVLRSERFKAFGAYFNFKEFDLNIIKKILRLGLPSGFQYFFEVGAFSLAVIMVGWLGTDQLAAHQIVISLASISFMAALGISISGSIRVGNAVGRSDVSDTRRAGFSAVMLAAFFMAFCGIIFITFKQFLPTLYISDVNVISIASTLLIVAALFQISDGIQAVGIGILRGLTDVKIPTAITFFAYWVLGLPIGYVLGFNYDLQVVGVWIGLLIGLTTSAILLMIRFNIKSKERIIV